MAGYFRTRKVYAENPVKQCLTLGHHYELYEHLE